MATRAFKIPEAKPPIAQWPVSVDISKFLNGEVIESVEFSAKDKADGTDMTSEVIHDILSVWTDTEIKPFIMGGEDGHSYILSAIFTTDGQSKDEITISWSIKEIY